MGTRNAGPRRNVQDCTFTYLTPKEYLKGGKWRCLCKCGNMVIVDSRNLYSGHTKSCGCYQRERASQNIVDITGMTFGCIEVLDRSGSDQDGQSLWNCKCNNCGNTFVARGGHLRYGGTQSCGCVHSRNETRISEILSAANIEYKTQYTFDDLRGTNGGLLRFDFAIFDRSGTLVKLIEFNGAQHYSRPGGSWASGYEALVENDRKKHAYCRTHNIPLYVIRYDEEYSLEDLIRPEPVEAIS